MFLKRLYKSAREYWLLSFVVVAMVSGGILYLTHLHSIANVILSAGALVSAIPLIADMITTLRGGSYGIDILAATAIIASVILGQYWAAMIIALMLTGGEALEDFAENRAKSELKSLLDNRPKLAHLLVGKTTKDIKVGEIKVGNKLQILPGEVIPVDCKILSGATSVDESSLTGESLPIDKLVGDEILSGSINMQGSITVKAIRSAKDSQYEQIIALVKAATSSQSPFVRLADRYSVPFTFLAYTIAIAVWIVSGHAIRFLEVIVVATPCPLLLAAPIALISGMSRAANHGIIIKNGSALEKLAEVQTIAFDKTGTLTHGKAVVSEVEAFRPYTKKDVLKFAAALELNSNHVLAQAIISEAQVKKLKTSAAKGVKEVAGFGLIGRVQGKELIIGRRQLMEENGISLPKESENKAISTVSYVAIDGVLAGKIYLADELRPETQGLIKRLKRDGIKHILMVTGDNESIAKSIAKKLGINDYYANALPADKLKAIESVSYRPLAFVGDGINDAPVLTMADVGIALGAKGSTAASESADIVIILDDLRKVASGLEIAKRTFFIAKQSILVGVFISVALMVVFASGHFKPIIGALLQELVDVIVIFNALRAHSIWQAKRAKAQEARL